MGWVQRFRPELQLWGELLHLVEVTEHFVRTQGLARGTERQLRHLLAPLALTPRAQKVRAHLLAFVAEESVKAHPNERLLGSSEVIESVFGKFKRLEDTQAKNGFTGLLLTMSDMVAHTTREIVQQAPETVPTKCVLAWCKKMLGDSLHAQRKKAFGPLLQSGTKMRPRTGGCIMPFFISPLPAPLRVRGEQAGHDRLLVDIQPPAQSNLDS